MTSAELEVDRASPTGDEAARTPSVDGKRGGRAERCADRGAAAGAGERRGECAHPARPVPARRRRARQRAQARAARYREAHRYAIEGLAAELLAVRDSLELGVRSGANADARNAAGRAGGHAEAARTHLREVLDPAARPGRRSPSIPTLHEAVLMQESGTAAPNTRAAGGAAGLRAQGPPAAAGARDRAPRRAGRLGLNAAHVRLGSAACTVARQLIATRAS